MNQAIARLHSIPRLNWGNYPTPLETMPRLRAALIHELGHDNIPQLFIKRDDYTGPGFGGNKVRKLEYVLAQAQADGAQVVITVGGEKSNHARVTAAMCARLGLHCVLVLNEAAIRHTGWQPASFIADELYGAEIHLVGNRAERTSTMSSLASVYQLTGKRVVEIPLGASIPLGALGFVRAIEELQTQLGDTRLTHIFHCSSSAGTQAGIRAGCQLFNLNAQVIGISPDDPAAAISAHAGEIIDGIGTLLGTQFDNTVTVDDGYCGDGYGIDSPAGTAALKLVARTEGVILDPVYSAKAMAGLLAWIRQGKLTKADTVLFWHTGGQLALFYSPENA